MMPYRAFKRTLLCLGIGLGVITTAQAEESASKSALKVQGNLETALTSKRVIRTRALPTIAFSRGKFSLEYLGLHEIENLATASYLGWQILTAGTTTLIQPALAAEITPETADFKVGIRNSSLIERLKGYGFISGVTNRTAGQIIWLYGKQLGNTSAEMLGFLEFPYTSKPALYTEFQLNQNLGKHAAVFARAESDNLRMKQARYLAGLAIKK